MKILKLICKSSCMINSSNYCRFSVFTVLFCIGTVFPRECCFKHELIIPLIVSDLGQDLLRAEGFGTELSVLSSGAGGRVVRWPPTGVPEVLEGVQQHGLHGVW